MIIMENKVMKLPVFIVGFLLLSSCNDDFYKNVHNVKLGDSKEAVINILGKPDTIRQAYYDSRIVMFDYGISSGASGERAIYFNSDTTCVVGIALGD